MKDIRQQIDTWYVIDGEEHIKVKDFNLGVEIMKELSKDNPGEQVIMLSQKEYYSRYTKRGKKSGR